MTGKEWDQFANALKIQYPSMAIPETIGDFGLWTDSWANYLHPNFDWTLDLLLDTLKLWVQSGTRDSTFPPKVADFNRLRLEQTGETGSTETTGSFDRPPPDYRPPPPPKLPETSPDLQPTLNAIQAWPLFGGDVALTEEEGGLVFWVANSFQADTIERRYLDRLMKAAGQPVRVQPAPA